MDNAKLIAEARLFIENNKHAVNYYYDCDGATCILERLADALAAATATSEDDDTEVVPPQGEPLLTLAAPPAAHCQCSECKPWYDATAPTAPADVAEASAIIDNLATHPLEDAYGMACDHIRVLCDTLARVAGERDAVTQSAIGLSETIASMQKAVDDLDGQLRATEQERNTAIARAEQAERERDEAIKNLDWQNHVNKTTAVESGYEFYVNEEWTGIRDAAIGDDPGYSATLRKTRYDCDDDRVRIRRVLDDDRLIAERDTLRTERDAARAEMEATQKELAGLRQFAPVPLAPAQAQP